PGRDRARHHEMNVRVVEHVRERAVVPIENQRNHDADYRCDQENDRETMGANGEIQIRSWCARTISPAASNIMTWWNSHCDIAVSPTGWPSTSTQAGPCIRSNPCYLGARPTTSLGFKFVALT